MSVSSAALVIDVGYACYWVEVDRQSGAVLEAPPVARWMIGKQYTDVWRWVLKKQGSVRWHVEINN